MYILLFSATLLVAANAAPRIHDGHDSSIKDFPYQVSIEMMSVHICGGSILNENWIITAGHCDGIVGLIPDLVVRSGTDKRGLGGSLHEVDKVVKHEKYSVGDKDVLGINDIALMRVKEPFTFDETRQPIDLFASGEKLVPGKMANVSGFCWNTGIGSINTVPRNLQSVKVPLIDLKTCDEAYADVGGVPEGYICAADGKNICRGDDGGPLTIDGRLAGIVSWIKLRDQYKYPTLFTDVAYYRDWIDQHLKY